MPQENTTYQIETPRPVYLVFTDTVCNNNKFWKANIKSNLLEVSWGRIGSQGQTKIHPYNSNTEAIAKLNQLVQQKIAKGYRQSSESPDKTTTIIVEAIRLLQTIRQYILAKDLDHPDYIEALNKYLQLIPTKLERKIDHRIVFRRTVDIDRQIEQLEQFAAANQKQTELQQKPISLKTIAKSLWRYLE